jgi:hypothetical protein
VPCEIEVPAVDFNGLWAFQRISNKVEEMLNVSHGVGQKDPYWPGVPDIDAWLRAYRSDGRYEEWPQSLTPSSLGAGYSDGAAIAVTALQFIRKSYRSRRELIDNWRKSGSLYNNQADGFSLQSIAFSETDLLLGYVVGRLARSRSLPAPMREELGRRLQDEYARYPRKKIGARIGIAELLSYLSLPVWKKRHELYAVWIATEIVNALPEHECEIHHEDGKIVFAFRETLVATVKSSWPSVRLISERRVPLAAPVGKRRSGNVQPDYGLWRNRSGVETCGLVVEVKHYKRSASSSFGDALTDYSRAFPEAEVYLVNHGPIGDALSGVPRELASRCHAIKNLTAVRATARDELREAVRKYVGEPVAWRARKGFAADADAVLAVDISGSMSRYVDDADFLEMARDLANERCANAALIDTQVRAFVAVEKLPEAIKTTRGGSTSLGDPVKELLSAFKRVLVLTDDDGANSLTGPANQNVISRRAGLVAIEVTAE